MNTKCPYCDYIATEHETLDGERKPAEDDISLCIKCGGVSSYSKGILVKVNIEELDPETKKAVRDLARAWVRTRQLVYLDSKDWHGEER